MSLTRRVLFVAWQNPATRRFFTVGRLLDRVAAPRWEFVYVRGATAATSHGFRPFIGLDSTDVVYESDDLPPFFANRLMPKNRPDFPEFLHHLGLPAAGVEEVPILARSEGRRAAEDVELFGLPTFDDELGVYRFYFFLRGVRHVQGAEALIARLKPKEQLLLAPDAANPVDQLAVQVQEGKGARIGWVPATLVEDLDRLRQAGSALSAFAEQINPAPAPVQLRLLCRLEVVAVPGFEPFASDQFQPIPANAVEVRARPSELVG